jgi:hypothetical protein
MNVTVCVARTAQPSTRPVSLSRPLGMSTARTGAPAAFIASTSEACAPAMSRCRPMPKSPSTTSPHALRADRVGDTLPPASCHARYAARASVESFSSRPVKTTETSNHHCFK